MNLSFRENYFNSPELKKNYIGFLIKIFGPEADLSIWDKLGFWDEKYRSFSYFDGKSLVSNVSIYTTDMIILGERCRVAQISGVGTIPEYRRKGLAFELMQVAMAWARKKHDLFFLGADLEAFPLYRKCGFRLTDEYKAYLAVKGKKACPGAVKLDMERKDHVEQVYQLASIRQPVSNIIGVLNEKLLMAACLCGLKARVHYISELDILVLYKRVSGRVTIFDIVGFKMPPFAEIYPFICHPEDRAAEFIFMVDKLNLGKFEQIRIERTGRHLLGNFPLEGTKFIFPYTSNA